MKPSIHPRLVGTIATVSATALRTGYIIWIARGGSLHSSA